MTEYMQESAEPASASAKVTIAHPEYLFETPCGANNLMVEQVLHNLSVLGQEVLTSVDFVVRFTVGDARKIPDFNQVPLYRISTPGARRSITDVVKYVIDNTDVENLVTQESADALSEEILNALRVAGYEV